METKFKFIDLFCGIGGFYQAMKLLGGEACLDANNFKSLFGIKL